MLLRIKICILSLFTSVNLFSQNINLDSLNQVIENPSISASEKLYAHLELGKTLIRINPEKSKSHLLIGKEMISRDKIEHEEANLQDFNYFLSVISYFNESYEEAHNYLDELEENLGSTNNVALNRVRLYSRRGMTYGEEGELEKAISSLNKSYRIALKENNDQMLLMVTNQMAKYYNKYKGRRDSAIFYTLESTKYRENDKNHLAITFMNLALLNLEIKQDSAALEYYLKTLELEEHTIVPLIPVLAAKGAGILYRDKGEYETSKMHLLHAVQLSENLNDKKEKNLILIELGVLNKHMGNKKEAIKHIETAYNYFVQTNNKAASNYAAVNLSDICFANEREMSQNFYDIVKGYEDYNSLSIETQKKALLIQGRLGEKFDDFENALKSIEAYNEIVRKENEEGRALIAEQYQEGYEAKLKAKIKQLELEELKEEQKRLNLKYVLYGIGCPLLLSLIGLFYNYSRQREFKKDLKIRSKNLEILNKNLALKNEELNSFAYVSSHDLKTPLMSLIGFTKLLKEEIKDDPIVNDSINEYLRYIESSSSQMKNLLDNILIYAKLGNINIKDDQIEVDINDLIKEITEELTEEFSKPISIIYDGHVKQVNANEKVLKIFFKNIIHNGLLFNESEIPKVVITSQKKKNLYEFIFIDNGIGIEEKHFDEIFTLFNRLHNQKKYEGAGLGLGKIKKIVDEVKGDISLNSTVGKGSEFKVNLPIWDNNNKYRKKEGE